MREQSESFENVRSVSIELGSNALKRAYIERRREKKAEK